MAGDGGTLSPGDWRILPADDALAWREALARFPGRDVYYDPAYQRAMASHLGGQAYAYVAAAGRTLLFHPVILRPIRSVGRRAVFGGLHDAETAYGYGGPLVQGGAGDDLAPLWEGYEAWCRRRHMVCEFLRFHPLLETQRAAPPGTRLWRDRATVVLPLSGGEDDLLQCYAGVHRTSLRKALKSGLVCEERTSWEGLAAFRLLYGETMRAVGATSFYAFDAAHFAALADGLGERLRLFLVRQEQQAIAGALLLLGEDTAHYHLAGSSRAHASLCPNNLLIHGMARWAQERGFRRLHLGGGRTAAPDDPLFRFKARFSPERRDFWLGARIVDAAAHARLVELWREQAGVAAAPNYLQVYRLPTAGPGLESAA